MRLLLAPTAALAPAHDAARARRRKHGAGRGADGPRAPNRRVGACASTRGARRRSRSAETRRHAAATTSIGFAADGVDVVRRPTGGRAILHHREITYSVTAPIGRRRRSARRRTSGSIASSSAVSSASASTRLVATPAPRAAAPGMAPCFDEPAAGELTVAGRKLAGSAQWRADGRAAAARIDPRRRRSDVDSPHYTRGPSASRFPRPATLGDLLGRAPSVADLAAALAQAVRDLEDPDATLALTRRRGSCPSLGPRRPICRRRVDLATMIVAAASSSPTAPAHLLASCAHPCSR